MRHAVGLGILLAVAGAIVAQQDPLQDGPTTLVIQYRCVPAERAALRSEMESSDLRNFESWKTNGILLDYHMLFSRYVDSNNWDMMAILQFRDYASVAKWSAIERKYPAGLQSGALKSMLTISSYPVDAIRAHAPDPAVPRPVYLVIPYAVTTPDYPRFVDGSVIPQVEQWMTAGVLSGYSVLTQRYGAARPWDSLTVLEYKDNESFGLREKVAAQVLQTLRGNPAFAAFGDGQNIRVEKEAVIAEELRPAQ